MNLCQYFFPYYAQCTGKDAGDICSSLMQERKSRTADKSLLDRRTVLDQASQFPGTDGCYQLTYQGAHFDFFFKSHPSDRLYVFLDGARFRDGGKRLAPLPNYICWSWYPNINANLLCFEDPMYYTFPDLKLGWFFGTQDQDYRQLLAQVVRDIAETLGVPNQNIVLYGRSGGGTAALFTTQYLPGSTGVGVNPQICLSRYGYTASFRRVTGLDPVSGAYPDRADLASVIRRHPESRFLVLGNLLSARDMSDHVLPLGQALEITPSYGAVQKENAVIWLFHALGPGSAHNSFENVTVFQLIDLAIQSLREHPEALSPLSRYANELWDRFSAQERTKAALEQQLLPDGGHRQQTLDELKAALKEQKITLAQQEKTIARQQKLINAADRSPLYRLHKLLRRFRKKLSTLFLKK